MTSIPGDGTSSVRAVGATAATRSASAPLVVGAAAAWLAITFAVGLRQGFLFVIGIGLGAVLAGVSFGFTTGWRAWIRDRDPTGFLAVPRLRGQQLKDTAQLDGWVTDGSRDHVASLCSFPN